MSRLIIFGATGSLGSHVARQAISAGHRVTVLVRNSSKLSPETRAQVSVHQGDISALAIADIAELIRGHDALVNCAGLVTDGQPFVDLVDRLVTSVESLPHSEQPVCWFLAGLAILDIGLSGRKGIDLPGVSSTYWPHRANFERLSRTNLDWRLLCPGPMVDEPAIGPQKLRIAPDVLPVEIPASALALPGPELLPVFMGLIPEMIVPYADAASVMLGRLDRSDPFTRHRVGLALPSGMRGKKPQWAARPRSDAPPS
jgi:putative NADH-flavin reductase